MSPPSAGARPRSPAVRPRPLVAGIDGGATSTTCLIADGEGRVLGAGRGGPVDHLYRAAGRRQTRAALAEAIGSACRAAGLRVSARHPVEAVVAGLTGLEPGSPESGEAVRMIRDLLPARLIRATWDAEIALHGATAGGPGVMVIGGTGSVALGRNAAGRTARAGGYGFLIDDAGGGVSIGAAGLRAALRALDGRGPETMLRTMVEAQLGPWREFRARVYGEGGGRPFLASLTSLVLEAARRGDAVAAAILEDAGRALASLALAVAARLGMLEEPFDLFLVGGVFAMGAAVVEPLRGEVLRRAPACAIRRPRLPPAAGAVLMALEAAGAPASGQVMARLEGRQPERA